MCPFRAGSEELERLLSRGPVSGWWRGWSFPRPPFSRSSGWHLSHQPASRRESCTFLGWERELHLPRLEMECSGTRTPRSSHFLSWSWGVAPTPSCFHGVNKHKPPDGGLTHPEEGTSESASCGDPLIAFPLAGGLPPSPPRTFYLFLGYPPSHAPTSFGLTAGLSPALP